ncbi:hypothetical protein C0Q70_13515 [Pomacea canaliculata]|uniref:Major facilitator superfamily (MFS) profile domain-containing protein n=1 Tax=Pomacea canaliculata TaxID=400727 RepID=A0A2T7NXG5_POMCA|nr:hypothetical protein C0Q70_13515 [Pomacea canaliculata]
MADIKRLLSDEQETHFGEDNHLLTPPVEACRGPPLLAHSAYGRAEIASLPLTLRGVGRRWGHNLPSYRLRSRESLEGHTSSYSPHRARLALLIFLFLRDVATNTSGSIGSQYMNYRFQRMYVGDGDVNSTVTTTNNASVCSSTVSNATNQEEDEAQKQLTAFNLYVFYTGTCTMIVAAFFMGALSDVKGRSLLLVLPSLASLLDHVYHLLMMWFDLDVRFLYLVAALHGITGSYCALSMGIFAVTADLTPPSKSRTMAIAVMEFVTAIAAVVGKLVSGYLLQNFGYFNASLLPALFYLASFLVCVVAVPETVPLQDREKQPRCPNPLKSVKNIFIFYIAGPKWKRFQFTLSLLLLSVITVCTAGHGGVFTLYLLAPPFCWDPEQFGVYGAAGTATQSFSRLIGLKTMHVFFSDSVILLLAIMSLAGSLVIEGLSSTTAMMYGSKYTRPSAHGGSRALFTSIAVVETVCSIASTTAYNTLYSATLSYMRGAVFLYMAAGLAFCILIILGLMRIAQLGPSVYEEVLQEEEDQLQTT